MLIVILLILLVSLFFNIAVGIMLHRFLEEQKAFMQEVRDKKGLIEIVNRNLNV